MEAVIPCPSVAIVKNCIPISSCRVGVKNVIAWPSNIDGNISPRKSLRTRKSVSSLFVCASSLDESSHSNSKEPSNYEYILSCGGYNLIAPLGSGSQGATFEASPAAEDSDSHVAIKVISLRSSKGWKGVDLFERETRVLRSLKHVGIPSYISHFHVDTDNDRYYCLVQNIAPGQSLADLVANGWRVAESEVCNIALQMLDILSYLESLRPPVVHRDIKPENIIRDEISGRIQLVNFGSVLESSSAPLAGSTAVIGTYGYMAPEQLQNQATAKSDLYSLGATLLFLLSGRHPSSFPQKRLRIDFKPWVNASSDLLGVVDKLLQSLPEDRFQSAAEVVRALKYGFYESLRKESVKRPPASNIVLTKSDSRLSIIVPVGGITGDDLGNVTFAVAWLSFVAFWTVSTVVSRGPILLSLFSAPFWFSGGRMVKSIVEKSGMKIDLQFDRSSALNQTFHIKWTVGNLWKHEIEGLLEEIASVRLVSGVSNGDHVEVLAGSKSFNFGQWLTRKEKEWIVSEISDFLF